MCPLGAMMGALKQYIATVLRRAPPEEQTLMIGTRVLHDNLEQVPTGLNGSPPTITMRMVGLMGGMRHTTSPENSVADLRELQAEGEEATGTRVQDMYRWTGRGTQPQLLTAAERRGNNEY